jgi:hypothetical protein
MRKEEIYVEINNEAEQMRAIEILQKAGEKIGDVDFNSFCYKLILSDDLTWWVCVHANNKTQITLDQLDQLLNQSIDKEIESFKERMKQRGFEISVVIEKEVIKPDDVVMYWYEGCIDRVFVKYKNFSSSAENVVKVTDEHVLKFLDL